MSCRGCNAEIDCENPDEMFPYSLTGNSVFPFIIVCPTNANCFTAPTIRMTCCQQPIQVVIPTDATQAERTALVQALLNQCQQLVNHCTTPTNPNNPDDPSGDPTFPTTWYYSNSRWQELACSGSYAGGTYRYTVESGMFMGSTQQLADEAAEAEALRLATLHKFCLNAEDLSSCKDQVTTFNIPTVGGTGPFTASVISGSLPTGMTLSVVGGTIRISGTPTVEADTSFTIKVNDSVGGYLTQELEITIEDCTGITGMYYALDEVTGGIAVDSFGVNDTDANNGSRTAVSGKIVAAWFFDSIIPSGTHYASTLSDKTLITSKSITIRFWVQYVETSLLPSITDDFVLATRYFKFEIQGGALDGAWNDGVGSICYANPYAVDDGNWHRIIFSYDATTGEARYYVDDNPATVETVAEGLISETSKIGQTPGSGVVAFQISPYVDLSGGYPPPYDQAGDYAYVNLDEIYIAPGVVWGDSQATYDWNSGAGRTYPDLPP